MSFGLETINRIESLFADTETEVDASASYNLIGYLLSEGYDSLALAVCVEFTNLHGPEDGFLVEGETSYSEVYFEALRRTVFNESHAIWASVDTATRRQAMVRIASDLSFRQAE